MGLSLSWSVAQSGRPAYMLAHRATSASVTELPRGFTPKVSRALVPSTMFFTLSITPITLSSLSC